MAKVGRNDPCICGSGKKYKKCCINKESVVSPINKINTDDDFIKYGERLMELSNSVVDLIDEGKLDEAEEVCHILLKEYPNDVDGIERLAEVYGAKGDKVNQKKYLLKTAEFMKANEGFEEETISDVLRDAEGIVIE